MVASRDGTSGPAWHNAGMKFRHGLIVGVGIGYVLGAKAGRERYDQIVGHWQRMTGGRMHDATARGRAVVDITTARARDAISEGLDGAAERLRDVVDGTG